jgi:UDP-N-acetylglucosamine--N-acetylmuramyl-(pentapeptide) pyrophosphoryl-undecaprenol N-acetylglucosamine transferase
MEPLRVLLAAAGTGGHLWPALSLAQALKAAEPEAEFLFVGSGRPLEEKILGPGGWPRATLKALGFKGGGLTTKIRALGRAALAVREAGRLIGEFRPSLCVGAGGYVTVPVGLAARLNGVKLALHEQNSRPGLANRALAPLAGLIMAGFEETGRGWPAAKTRVTGNPVRSEIEDLHGRERFFEKPILTVLVTGGSQGAGAVNRAASAALISLKASGRPCRVIHQSGAVDLAQVRSLYDQAGLEHRTEDFFQDMASLYGEADLVIARAGALTLAELAAAKLPAVLIPLPTAADDHQTINARALAARGAAVALPERDLSPAGLAALLDGLLGRPRELAAMSEAAGKAARLGAGAAMSGLCLEFCGRAERG